MLIVSAADVDRALTFPDLVSTLREAFRQGAVQPQRHHHTVHRLDGAASTDGRSPCVDAVRRSSPTRRRTAAKHRKAAGTQ